MKLFGKGLKWIFSCTLMCATLLLFFPCNIASAEEATQDFDAFQAAIVDMVTNFENEDVLLDDEEYVVEDGKVLVSENAIQKYDLKKADAQVQATAGSVAGQIVPQRFFAVENLKEKNGQVVAGTRINRLIVNCPWDVDTFGAVAVAQFNDWHILQYESHQQAQAAYEHLSNSNIDVCFDFEVTASDFEVDEQSFVATSQAVSTHNSWGEEFVGYDSFSSTTLMMHSQSALPQIVVAVIDSGIFADHPMFAGRILTSRAKNFSDEKKATSYEYEDLNGHGTHVSGTICEFTQSNVKILPLKVLNSEGKGQGASIIAALEYATTLKAAGVNIVVANMSLGIELAQSQVATGYAALTLAVRQANNKNIISVVSAGNESQNTIYCTPASVSEAFTVSALRRVANSSNGYDVQFDSSYSNFGTHVDFSAPGTYIKSAAWQDEKDPSGNVIRKIPGYIQMSGTSMAAPHVAAAVALVLSNPFYSNLTPDQVHALLVENAVDLGENGKDDLYGYGCINIAGIGCRQEGEVTFSESEKNHSTDFMLSLQFGSNANIYYTFEEAAFVDSSNGTLYTGPIQMSQTVRVFAMGYRKDVANKTLIKSKLSSASYYFDNMDYVDNFKFTKVGDDSYEISRYYGTELTTLQIPATYNGGKIVSIGPYAFSNSPVEVIYLPQSLQTIGQSAFSGDTALREVHCNSDEIEIGGYAFSRCQNLSIFDVQNVTKVGSYAFAYCSKLTTLDLMNATQIDSQALTGSGIKELYLGDKVSIGQQSGLALNCVHGFAGAAALSDAERLAAEFGGEFEDLTLKITENLNATVIVHSGESASFGMNYSGWNVSYNILLNGSYYTGSHVVVQTIGDGLNKWMMMRVSGGLNSGTNTFQVKLSDGFGNSITSRVMQIVVVQDEQSTFAINRIGSNFTLSVTDANGQVVTDSQYFFKSGTYLLEVRPEDGYMLQDVVVSEGSSVFPVLEQREDYAKIALSGVTQDVQVVVIVNQKSTLSVQFAVQDGGSVLLSGQPVQGNVGVQNGGTLEFDVRVDVGFELRRVLVDGEIMEGITPTHFRISNIRKDTQVIVLFNEIFHNVTVSSGKGGSISTSGGLEDKISYAEKREYHISASDGYVIDSVTVNGEKVDVVNGNFVVQNQLQDCDIVVSFKKAGSSLFESSSVWMVYFFIFIALLFIFILAKIILAVIRKNKKKDLS